MIARLLHCANASPPWDQKREFYALKERLLKRHGTPDGADVQHIEGKICFRCSGSGQGYSDYGWDDYCYRCDGTGWYKRQKWVVLNRYRFGGYTFHVPGEVSYKKPEPDTTRIEGYVTHSDYGDKSNTAFPTLCLLCGEWRMLWRWLCGSRRVYWYRCHPWFWLQAAITPVVWRLNERKRKREATRREIAAEVEVDEDVPF